MTASPRIPYPFQHLSFGREATDVADVQPVPYPYAGKTMTRANLIVCNILVVLPVLLLLGGLALAGFALFTMLAEEDNHRQLRMERMPLLAGGVLVAVAAGYFAMRHNAMLGNLYLLRVARASFRSRPDAIVDADDPEAEFIEITPRENWKKFMLDTAADTGFLKLDFERRQILFEGDLERYRIPVAAVESGRVEEVLPFGIQSESDALLFVILHVRTPAGPRELPFTPRAKLGMRTRRHREDWADDMLRRVRQLVLSE